MSTSPEMGFMKPRQPRQCKPAPKGKVGPRSVIATGAATFVAFLGLLGWQVAAGQDPALGHGKQKRKVVHRKLTHVVIHRVEDAPTYDDGYSSGGSYGYDSGSGYSSGGYDSGSSSGGYSSGSSSGGYSSGGSSSGGYSAPSAPSVSSGSSGG